MRYVLNGQLVNVLLVLASLNMHALIVSLMLLRYHLQQLAAPHSMIEYMAAFCVDGASVNCGARGGVKRRLSGECQWVLGMWRVYLID